MFFLCRFLLHYSCFFLYTYCPTFLRPLNRSHTDLSGSPELLSASVNNIWQQTGISWLSDVLPPPQFCLQAAVFTTVFTNKCVYFTAAGTWNWPAIFFNIEIYNPSNPWVHKFVFCIIYATNFADLYTLSPFPLFSNIFRCNYYFLGRPCSANTGPVCFQCPLFPTPSLIWLVPRR
jgi:hypothetical protein